jgi:DNA-binding NtrC family response regulator
MTGRIERRKVVSVVETLLLADGDETCRNALKFLLELAGYRVVEAAHGIEATQLLYEYGDRIHLVLVAADLPDISGPEWQSHTRVIAPDLPVVVLRDWDRVEAAMTPVGPWYGGLPARTPVPHRLLDLIRNRLDEHFFSRLSHSPAA